jgi:hypothetical protein
MPSDSRHGQDEAAVLSFLTDENAPPGDVLRPLATLLLHLARRQRDEEGKLEEELRARA